MPRHILFWVSREETSGFYCGVAFLPSSSKYFFNSSNSRAYFVETAVGLERILSLRKRRRSVRSAARRDSRSFNISASCSADFPRSASRWIPVRSFRLSSFPPAFAFNSSKADIGEIADGTCGGSGFFAKHGHASSWFFPDGSQLYTGFFPEFFHTHSGEGCSLNFLCLDLIQQFFFGGL